MTLSEATQLISSASISPDSPQTWADLGCGSGLFSQALARLLPADSTIHCCDRQKQSISNRDRPEVQLHFQLLNFETEVFTDVELDGIIMANSLHYVRDQVALLEKWKALLKPGGKFIIVEYDTDQYNPWVPYPVSREKLSVLAKAIGFECVRKLGERMSAYGSQIMYACELSRND